MKRIEITDELTSESGDAYVTLRFFFLSLSGTELVSPEV